MKSTKDLMQEHLGYRLELMEKLCNGILMEIQECKEMLDVISDKSGYWEKMDDYMERLEKMYKETPYPKYPEPFPNVVNVYGCPGIDPVNNPNIFSTGGGININDLIDNTSNSSGIE